MNGHPAWLIDLLETHRAKLAGALALVTTSSVAVLVAPWLIGQFSDLLLSGEGQGFGTFGILALLALLLGLRSLASFAASYTLGNVSAEIAISLRQTVFDRLQALPLAYHADHTVGESAAYIAQDISAVTGFVTGALVNLAPLLLTLLGAFLALFWLDSRIAIATLVLLPPLYLLVRRLSRAVPGLSRDLMDAYSSNLSRVHESLWLLPLIKAFNQESDASRKFEESNATLLSHLQQMNLAQSRIAPLSQFLAALGVLLLLAYSGFLVNTDAATPGEAISLLLYAILLTRPLSGLAAAYGQVQAMRGSMNRLQLLFLETTEPADGREPESPVRGAIEFREVSYHYPGQEELLTRVNLVIEPGEIVALTGNNGAGKTTLVSMLGRFREPASGAIYLDGVDISGLSLASLRQQVAWVLQDTHLFNMTIADNLRIGKASATEKELNAAIEAVGLGSYLASLTDGLDHQVGDGGLRMSGGEKQKIELARALLSERPILVLDEATAMLDSVSEERIRESLREALSGRTVILISHRESWLSIADRIVKLEAGQVVSSDCPDR